MKVVTAFQRIVSNYDNLLPILKSPKKYVNYFDQKYDDSNQNIIEQMQYLDFVTYLPDDILTKVDRASMHSSLEVRVPFLDNDVIQHALSLPIDKKIEGANGKIILEKF